MCSIPLGPYRIKIKCLICEHYLGIVFDVTKEQLETKEVTIIVEPCNC